MPLLVKSIHSFALSAAGLATGVLLGGFAAVPDGAWPGIQAQIPPNIGQNFFRDVDFDLHVFEGVLLAKLRIFTYLAF